MRRFLCCSVPRWGLTLVGLAAVTMAIAAWQLGLDNNPVMGPSRILLLLWGIGILIVAHHGLVAALLRGARDRSDTRPRTDPLALDQGPPEPHKTEIRRPPHSLWLAFSLIIPAVLALYLWQATAGEWIKPLPETTLFYDMLADAFASGQTFLKELPDPRLAQMSNPYDPAQRAGIPWCEQGASSGCFLWDASYFRGRYYVYWGPAPAVALTALKIGGVGGLGDLTIALIAAFALFCLLAYCLVDLWNRYFSELPRWLLLPPLLLAGLAYPLPWALDTPRIYEAAILLGAALLVWGLVVAVPAFASGDYRPGRLALVGVLWGLALGSRAVLGLPIAVLAGGLAWRMSRQWPRDSRLKAFWPRAIALGLPLAAAASLIGAYNYARFSSPWEFGYRYQLGPGRVQAAGALTGFDWSRVPLNAYDYLFAPVAIEREFPFLEPVLATRSLGPIQAPNSDSLAGGYVTGLLVATPFLFFAAYILWWAVCSAVDCGKVVRVENRDGTPDRSGLHGMVQILILASLAAFLPILSFVFAVARYLLDVTPLLTILAGLGAWTAYRTARTPETRWLISVAIVASAGASAIMSVLLALNNWQR